MQALTGSNGRGFGDSAGFGDAGGLMVSGWSVREDRPRRNGFGDADGFGDAGGFDYIGSARRRSDRR